ncbi:MAG: HAD-IIB family hydrolase [Caldisericia bacterium]|nr:HAD-IIB family hydrolase [Caldisericia bacterium]
MIDKLYISDLDGTLLKTEGVLSEYSKTSLNNMLSNGLQFTVASARNAGSIRKVLSGVNLTLPVIEINGAFLTNIESGKHYASHTINDATRKDLISIFLDFNYSPFITAYSENRDYLFYKTIENEGVNWYITNREMANEDRLVKVKDYAETLFTDTICFTAMDRKKKLQPLFHFIQKKYRAQLVISFFENWYSPGWYWLTIHDSKATKHNGILDLVSYTKQTLENVTVFGDQINDLSMFKAASRSVAVESATKELRKHATHIIGSNENDCVVKFIEKEFSKN